MRLFITLPADVAEAARGAAGRPATVRVLVEWDGQEGWFNAALSLEGPSLIVAMALPDLPPAA